MLNGFVDKVMALWGPIPGLDDDPADFPRFDAPDPAPQPADGDLDEQLLVLAGADGAIIAATLNLSGLGPVRSALGERWPALSLQIAKICKEVLARMVPPPDVHVQYDSDNVLVCFASSNRDLAEHRTALLAQALQAELEQQLQDLAGRTSVGYVVGKVVLAEIRAGTTELVGAVVHALDDIREEARRRGRTTTAAWVRSARMLFQPLWDVEHDRIGPNRCLLDIAGAGATLAQLETITGSEAVASAVARLDFLTFARAIEAVRVGPHDHRQAPLMVPLHHTTLSRRSWRADYVTMCAMVPESYRDFMLLEILGVPAEATARELGRWVTQLSAFTAGVVLQLSLRTAQPNGLAEIGLRGLSFNFAELGRLPHLQKPLRALARLARTEGLVSYAVGAATIGQAEAARAAGFNFVGGAAIHATVAEPKTAARFVPLPHRRSRPGAMAGGVQDRL